jgi:3-methyl-2-oxobutanoate hydroxymethyltransferase
MKSPFVKNNNFSMVTCYDYTSAKMIAKTNIESVLVGDSVAMVMHGYDSTVHATIEMLTTHTRAVAKGLNSQKYLVSDMPIGTNRMGKKIALESALELVRAGAHSVKIEGVHGHLDVIKHLIESGIPVVGHLGLTPQAHLSIGLKVQGKSTEQADDLLQQAQLLEQAGVSAIVLECLPVKLSEKITQAVSVPTIGIGAGAVTDGQVLVQQDMLGMDPEFHPKFLRKYINSFDLQLKAINDFVEDVKTKEFPSDKESYL